MPSWSCCSPPCIWFVGVSLGESPSGPAVLEAPCGASGRLQLAHRLVCVGAEWAAAVGDDLAVGGQLGDPPLELGERDRTRAVDVTGGELLLGAHVDEHHVTTLQALDELLAANRLDWVAEVIARSALDLGQSGGRGAARC